MWAFAKFEVLTYKPIGDDGRYKAKVVSAIIIRTGPTPHDHAKGPRGPINLSLHGYTTALILLCESLLRPLLCETGALRPFWQKFSLLLLPLCSISLLLAPLYSSSCLLLPLCESRLLRFPFCESGLLGLPGVRGRWCRCRGGSGRVGVGERLAAAEGHADGLTAAARLVGVPRLTDRHDGHTQAC
jgi:hypothetical protein